MAKKKSNETERNLYALKIGESTSWNDGTWIQRVPGGWIFNTYSGHTESYIASAFVPFPTAKVQNLDAYLQRKRDIKFDRENFNG